MIMNNSVSFEKEAKKYLFVGGVLFFFTIVTVCIATLPFLDFGERGFDGFDLFVGLLIASIKASFVATIFMHLNHEKKLIYWTIIASISCALSLFLITALAYSDPVSFSNFYLNP